MDYMSFLNNSKIICENGYKNIHEIVLDDKLYTHNGNYEKINLNIKKQYSGQLFKIRQKNNPNYIICSPYNKIFCKRYYVRYNFKIDNINHKKYIFTDEPEFIKAKDLIKNNYLLGLKINDNEIIPKHLNINDENKWWFMGLLLGNGWIGNLKQDSNKIFFLIENHNIENILKIYKNITFCNDLIKYKKYCIEDNELYVLFKSFFENNKRIIPEFIINGPNKYILSFLNGYLSTLTHKNKFKIFNINYEMAYSFQRIYAKLGKIAKIFKNIKYNTETYNIVLTNNINDISHISDGYIWFDVDDIQIINVSDVLFFDLYINKDNSYSFNNINVC